MVVKMCYTFTNNGFIYISSILIIVCLVFYFVKDEVSHCCLGLTESQGPSDTSASASQVARIPGTCHWDSPVLDFDSPILGFVLFFKFYLFIGF